MSTYETIIYCLLLARACRGGWDSKVFFSFFRVERTDKGCSEPWHWFRCRWKENRVDVAARALAPHTGGAAARTSQQRQLKCTKMNWCQNRASDAVARSLPQLLLVPQVSKRTETLQLFLDCLSLHHHIHFSVDVVGAVPKQSASAKWQKIVQKLCTEFNHPKMEEWADAKKLEDTRAARVVSCMLSTHSVNW